LVFVARDRLARASAAAATPAPLSLVVFVCRSLSLLVTADAHVALSSSSARASVGPNFDCLRLLEASAVKMRFMAGLTKGVVEMDKSPLYI
jgi:hypothetical protein